MAKQFVLARVTRIDTSDLNLYEFDLDLTMMIFFVNGDEKIYARYGGRDAQDADNRQSLEGLRSTMASVLAMHNSKELRFAEPRKEESMYVRDIMVRGIARGCVHCHQAKEMQYANLKRNGQWNSDYAWRYPLPDNLGFVLDVDKSNVVKTVTEKSPAAEIKMQPGDKIVSLNNVPIHSFADATYALDKAPKKGSIEISWQRDSETFNEKIKLFPGWRTTDISWRPSMWGLVPSLHVFGPNLKAEEKKELGLSPNALAFRQIDSVHSHARKAGIQAGDVIVGLNDKKREMDVIEFLQDVRRSYIVGDEVTINIIRDGKELKIPMKLIR